MGTGGLRRLGEFTKRFLKVLRRRLDQVEVIGLKGPFDRIELAREHVLEVGRSFFRKFADLLLDLVDHGLGLVLGVDDLGSLLVFLGVDFGFALGFFDLLFRKAAGAFDGDFLFLARLFIRRGDVEDSIGIDVKGHFDLRQAAGSGFDAGELEVTEELVVGEERTLTLTDSDIHSRLIVSCRRENLGFFDWHGGVTLDHGGSTAALGLNRESERSHVEKENVLHIALEHPALNGRTDGDHFVGVHPLVRCLAGEFLGCFDHLGHAGHAAHEDEFVKFTGTHTGFLEAIGDRLLGALEEMIGQLLQLVTAQAELNMLRSSGISSDEGKVEIVVLRRGERDLGLLSFFLNTLESVRLANEVDAFGRFKLGYDMVNESVVPVVTTELGVAVGREDLENTVGDFEHRDIEGSTTEVINSNLLIGLGIKSVSEGCGGRLVNDTAHFKTGDFTSSLGGVTL